MISSDYRDGKNMTTQSAITAPTPAVRSAIQKTFVQARLLAGFMSPQHFEQLAGEYLVMLDDEVAARLRAEAATARALVSALPPFVQAPLVIREIAGPHIDAIVADPIFQAQLGQRPHRFAYVDLRQLVALQPWIEPRGDAIPENEVELLDFALPRAWDVPAEVSFVAPLGPIQILTSNPALNGLQMEMDTKVGKVILGAPKHPNLIQVVEFAGRAYLRNGYHRVVDALAAGRKELPAFVTYASVPPEVELPGPGMFALGYVMSLPRPPLLTDFATAVTVRAKVRERRYAMIVSLDVKPLVIGI